MSFSTQQSPTAPPRVLIVDNDEDLLPLLALAYQGAGYATECAANGSIALELLQRSAFSLLVLDINMPAPNGIEVCAAVRRTSTLPILVLSGYNEEQTMLSAFDAGADAYLVKPFSLRALLARSQALLRRADFVAPWLHGIGKFKLDTQLLQLNHPGGQIQLSKIESRVLQVLMEKTDQAIHGRDALAEISCSDDGAGRHTIKQVIFRLRRKFADVPALRSALRTTNGGYLWTEKTSECEEATSEEAASVRSR